MLTLWSIARSPLIIGGHLPKNDEFTLDLLTNDEVLRVDQHSKNNRQLWKKGDLYAWAAEDDENPDCYVALFNAADGPGERPYRSGSRAATRPTTITINLADVLPRGMTIGKRRRTVESQGSRARPERVDQRRPAAAPDRRFTRSSAASRSLSAGCHEIMPCAAIPRRRFLFLGRKQSHQGCQARFADRQRFVRRSAIDVVDMPNTRCGPPNRETVAASSNSVRPSSGR